MGELSPSSATRGTGTAIVLAGAVIAGAYYFAQVLRPSEPRSPVGVSAAPTVAGVVQEHIEIPIHSDDPILGDPQAAVTVILFTDFECPYCREFHQTTFQQLKHAFIDTGHARVVYKDFPLTQIHPHAEAAAQAAHCAHPQGKFWEYADRLFAGNALFEQENFVQYAEAIGIDSPQFTACLSSDTPAAQVARNVHAAVTAGITATPALVINGQLFEGALPYDVLAPAITATPAH